MWRFERSKCEAHQHLINCPRKGRKLPNLNVRSVPNIMPIPPHNQFRFFYFSSFHWELNLPLFTKHEEEKQFTLVLPPRHFSLKKIFWTKHSIPPSADCDANKAEKQWIPNPQLIWFAEPSFWSAFSPLPSSILYLKTKLDSKHPQQNKRKRSTWHLQNSICSRELRGLVCVLKHRQTSLSSFIFPALPYKGKSGTIWVTIKKNI